MRDLGGHDDKGRRSVGFGEDPATALVLVESGAVFGEKAPASIVADNEREHAVVWHEDEVVVAI
jgi:hypothetical protein